MGEARAVEIGAKREGRRRLLEGQAPPPAPPARKRASAQGRKRPFPPGILPHLCNATGVSFDTHCGFKCAPVGREG
jgi:hypothetical protein